MGIDRREMLVGGALLGTMLAAPPAGAAPVGPAPPGLLEVLRIHVGPDGKSQASRVKVYGARKPIPAISVEASSIGAGDGRWGNVPTKRFTINAVGDLETELGDGSKVRIGKGDLVFIEDMTGTGHFTRFLSAVANLYVVVPDDFDLLEWAGQPPA
ncbi:MAG TPA: hypothetical protein VL100_07715 [Croceibacterium sp.]|nr:hypothetical protein [Croceibacterium sp.]